MPIGPVYDVSNFQGSDFKVRLPTTEDAYWILQGMVPPADDIPLEE